MLSLTLFCKLQQQQPSMGMQGSMGAWPQQQQQNPNPFGQQQQQVRVLHI